MLIFAPGLLLAVIGMFGGPALVREFFMLLAVPTVGLCLALLALIAAQAALKWHDVVELYLRLRGDHGADLLVSRPLCRPSSSCPTGALFVTRLSYSAMLVAIGAGLTWRFARALNQVDSFAGHLIARCARPRSG